MRACRCGSKPRIVRFRWTWAVLCEDCFEVDPEADTARLFQWAFSLEEAGAAWDRLVSRDLLRVGQA